MKDHYDLDKLKEVHPRGYYAKKMKKEGAHLVFIKDELFQKFSSVDEINKALEEYLAKHQPAA